MAVKSGFFMSVNGDRRYDAAFFAEYFASFIGNGIFPNPSTNLQVVEGSNMQTVVKPGKGWINGYYVHNDSDFILQHDVADGVLKRIDRVVLQWNYLTRQIVIVLKKGTLASSPVAPALVRNTDYYELALADVLISNGITRITQAAITDQRLNSALCGVVTQTVKTVDTTTLFNQYQSWINQQKAHFESNVNGWLISEQVDFRDWRTSIEGTFNSWMIQEQNDFENWYQSLQDLLDENVAATLTSKVQELEANKASSEDLTELQEQVTTHLAESNQNAHKAKNIVLDDTAGLFVAGNVEEGMKELFTNVSNGKRLVGTAITDVDNSLVVPADPSFQNLADLIRGISTGKKSASGTGVSSSSSKSYTYPNGNVTNTYSVTISGLDFTPNIIIIWDTTGISRLSIFLPTDFYYVPLNGGRIMTMIYTAGGTGSHKINLFKINNVISGNTYTIPFEHYNTNVRWIAFE